MRNVRYKNFIIKESDVKKLRCFPKRKLDSIEDYNIYIAFLQLMAEDDYKCNCKGIYLLNYMEKYRNTSEMILPMRRFLKDGDDTYFTNPPVKYRYAF